MPHTPSDVAATGAPDASSDLAPGAHTRTSVGAAASSFVGTTIEWYDYFLYGTAAALVLPTVFFDALPAAAALLVSLASFAVAFVLRPLGGAIFGHFGDRIGRKTMLLITIVGMGTASGLIGALPPQSAIGVAAPILLITLRMVQGFMLGGEWGGAALMSVEHAPVGRRGFYGATMQAGVPAGLLLSTGAFAAVSALPDEAFFSWGWRIPFLLSFPMMLIALIIRVKVSEPPAFVKIEEANEKVSLPIAEVFRHEKRKLLLLTFLQSACNIGYFLITVYALTYVTQNVGLPRSTASLALLVGAAVDLVAQPIFGRLSDRFGRRPVYAVGVIFLGIFAFPLFLLLDSASTPLIVVAFALGLGIGHAATGSLHGGIYAEQFPTRYRDSGSSMGFQVASLVTSAPTPALAALLVATFGSPRIVALGLIGAAVISLACLLGIRETYREPIDV